MRVSESYRVNIHYDEVLFVATVLVEVEPDESSVW
jgi:hypothetical protein